MGIRYLAVSIDNDDYERIKAGPCVTCGSRPHPRDDDDYGYDEEGYSPPATLDLDKTWRYLQSVLRDRPSAALVEGHVTHTSRGWISHQGLLSPQEVEEVAVDFSQVTALDVRNCLTENAHRGFGLDDRLERDIEYVTHYLPAAQNFVREAASAGRGVMYYIG